jgi:hypothetical protein
MFVESMEPPKSKVVVILSILVGFLNAVLWIIVGSRILFVPVSQISPWWVLFCLILNIGVAFAISRQRTRQFRRLYWIVGVTLFVTIACAFLLAFWASADSTDFGGLAFLVGAGWGAIIGLVIGMIIGIKTSPSEFSSVNIIQRIGEGIVTSTLVGIIISAISVFIMATSVGLQAFVGRPNYSNLIEHVLLNVLFITPAGAIPSVITGITTTLMIYAANWWLQRQSPVSHVNVG